MEGLVVNIGFEGNLDGSLPQQKRNNTELQAQHVDAIQIAMHKTASCQLDRAL